jgi:ABC-type oligopeptide transport system ATPase subunit
LKPKLIVAYEPVSMVCKGTKQNNIGVNEKFEAASATAGYIDDDIAIMCVGKIVELGLIDQIFLNALEIDKYAINKV